MQDPNLWQEQELSDYEEEKCEDNPNFNFPLKNQKIDLQPGVPQPQQEK
jgi:hypothetical protein